MRQLLLVALASGLLLAGCGQAGTAPVGAGAAATLAASAAKPKLPAEVADALARFSKQEGRKVTAKTTPMNLGRGQAEFLVRLSAADQSMLVQLYRLHAQRLDASEFPAGLVDRSVDHLAAIHRYTFADQPAWEPSRLKTEMRTRCYRDGDGSLLAYESWLVGDNYQAFAKYDLKGRILKVDMVTWEN
ncbi:hypothetical protein D3C72_1496560 [compost metagenome]